VGGAVNTVMGLSSEWLAIISLIFLLFAFFLYIGKSKTLSFVIALYLSSFTFSLLPYKENISEFGSTPDQSFWLLFGTFIIFFLLANWIMRSIIWEDYPSNTVRKWVEAGTLSVVTAGSIITLLTIILNLETIYPLSQATSQIFSGETSLFWSNIASLAVLFFVARD